MRARAGRWRPAVLFNAALAAAAICSSWTHQWLPLALLIEAEALLPRGRALPLAFPAHAGGRDLRHANWSTCCIEMVAALPRAFLGAGGHRSPWAAFYLNRALQSGGQLYGYSAAALAALVAGFEAADPPGADASGA